MKDKAVDQIVDKLLGIILSGGQSAISAILLMIIIGLIFDRRRLIGDLNRKDEKIDKIVDDYYRGNMTLADAMNSLKAVLYEIRISIK